MAGLLLEPMHKNVFLGYTIFRQVWLFVIKYKIDYYVFDVLLRV